MIRNPYKTQPHNQRPKTVHLQCDVYESDWLEIHHRLPRKGVQDAILATLFHAFINSIKEELPPKLPYERNEEQIGRALHRYTSARVARSGSIEA